MLKEGYKTSEIGFIPHDWKCAQIDEVIKDISMGPFGSDITVSNFVKTGVPVLNGYNVSSERLKDDFVNYVTPTKAKSLNKAVAHRGDIVVTHRGTLGQISFIPPESQYQEYVISQSQFRVTFDSNLVHPHFVVLYFLSPKGQYFLLEKKGHTGVPAIAQPTTTFRKLFLPMPSMKEQKVISKIFSSINTLIGSMVDLITKKQAIKQGLMKEFFTGTRRLNDFCGEWTKTNLDYCLNKIVGGGTPSKKVSKYWNGNIPWATVKDFSTYNPNSTQEYITEMGLQNSSTHLIPKGTLITSTRMGLGKTVVYNVDVAINQDLKALFLNENCDLNFMYYWFEFNQKNIESLGTGSTVKGIRIEQLKELEILLPNKEEQVAIANILIDTNNEIDNLKKELCKYQKVKQGMMSELLTGQIRLSD